MPHQSCKIGCVYKTPFHKSGHIYSFYIIIIIIIIMYRPPKEYYVHIISYIVSNLHKLYLNSSTVVDEITDSGRLFHIRIVEG